MQQSPLIHQVWFSLNPGTDADQFIESSRSTLAGLPGVGQFTVYRQVSVKNDYDFGFSMVFADQAAYDLYNNHPEHLHYVENIWKTQVAQFLEIDYKAYEE